MERLLCKIGLAKDQYKTTQLLHSINELPPQHRQAIELHFLQELSRKQIAIQLGWSYSKVHNRITRGITLLKWKLNPAYFDEMNRISKNVLISSSNGKEQI
jgi:DNA-directed RNA polymerase specialized sigma24 family protein